MSNKHGGKRLGAGRPRSDDPLWRRTIALRVSEWEELESIQKIKGLSLVDTLRWMIRETKWEMRVQSDTPTL